MRIIKSKKVNNENLKFSIYNYDDYVKLNDLKKADFDKQIKDVLKSISYDFKDIERCQNDIVIVCQNSKSAVVGFIHLLPKDYNNIASQNRFSNSKMYVDYIAVNPNYQGYGIATKLYALAICNLLECKQVVELTAILFDEYSRRAFEKTVKRFNLKTSENALDGSIVAYLLDVQK